MEKVGQTLHKSGHSRHFDAHQVTQLILSDPDVVTFINQHGLTQDEIKRSLPKFNQFINERRKFQDQEDSYIAKGYEPILTMNEGYADVTYLETRELKEAQEQKAIENRINLVSLPKSYKSISFDDVLLDDVKRLDVYESLVDFISQYPSPDQKGLYLYGDMGVGKSFFMAALAHELSEKKSALTTILHYPSFTIDIKNAIKTDSVKDEIDAVKTSEVLVLDDIGAEQTSSWVRDEVLQVILQYRMQENLPTFFTSNYSFADLERKLANGRNGDETWQAKRVMERVRFLAKETHLQGENRR
ncbi:primosomal protein DnaI [Streptococcus pluranimalium]|uniref:Primosomal protein DnaI n=1 Tax=Streptococcus pluranimalium TaxID=82348 RepID=A0A2L0D2W4_9STRE|nr:primosomal protein DnaI [Streptococcus pluranimalium]AUW95980.1 primosomal protein DnaI [Streptococcus pluranimalium]AXJ12357.1 Primosomal protein DnaI [Streptococcus pluranimalium]HEM6116075.1 primosomal protein DnaI [Streptococcus suis]